MPGDTDIEWATKVWNFVTGCNKVDAGCKFCYADRLWPRVYGRTGRAFTDVAVHNERMMAPLAWRNPERVFVNSMSDMFHASIPTQTLVDAFGVMALAYWHTFIILTKREERMQEFCATDHGIIAQFEAIRKTGGIANKAVFRALDRRRRDDVGPFTWPLPNVILGVSVSEQDSANKRIPVLMDTVAAIRGVSYEPAVGPVNFERICILPQMPGSIRAGIHVDALRNRHVESGMPRGLGPIDLVISGGESGPKARPSHPKWFRDARDQVTGAGRAFFHKQNGTWLPLRDTERLRDAHLVHEDGRVVARKDALLREGLAPERDLVDRGHPGWIRMLRTNKKIAGRELDGRTWEQFPPGVVQ